MLFGPRSHVITSAFKACKRLPKARWAVSIGLGSTPSNQKDEGAAKKRSLKRLGNSTELASFLRSIRTLKQSRGVSGKFARPSGFFYIEKGVEFSEELGGLLFCSSANTRPVFKNQVCIDMTISSSNNKTQVLAIVAEYCLRFTLAARKNLGCIG